MGQLLLFLKHLVDYGCQQWLMKQTFAFATIMSDVLIFIHTYIYIYIHMYLGIVGVYPCTLFFFQSRNADQKYHHEVRKQRTTPSEAGEAPASSSFTIPVFWLQKVGAR